MDQELVDLKQVLDEADREHKRMTTEIAQLTLLRDKVARDRTKAALDLANKIKEKYDVDLKQYNI